MNYVTSIFSILAIIISILAWRKNRAVYEIVSKDDKFGYEKINELLKTGKYTILHIKEDPLNHMRLIYILGKIQKGSWLE
ncbi:MAG: hypothetical protein WCW47_00980 [Candidatus Paceibacterota bacterium]